MLKNDSGRSSARKSASVAEHQPIRRLAAVLKSKALSNTNTQIGCCVQEAVISSFILPVSSFNWLISSFDRVISSFALSNRTNDEIRTPNDETEPPNDETGTPNDETARSLDHLSEGLELQSTKTLVL
ncbi:hypothetical protein [Bhargavaea ginsengi]|uniref:hypothetical protein n=1 Tax=Bhargavaea ginsengi TaxID=426757 RepID=UPI003C78A59A